MRIVIAINFKLLAVVSWFRGYTNGGLDPRIDPEAHSVRNVREQAKRGRCRWLRGVAKVLDILLVPVSDREDSRATVVLAVRNILASGPPENTIPGGDRTSVGRDIDRGPGSKLACRSIRDLIAGQRVVADCITVGVGSPHAALADEEDGPNDLSALVRPDFAPDQPQVDPDAAVGASRPGRARLGPHDLAAGPDDGDGAAEGAGLLDRVEADAGGHPAVRDDVASLLICGSNATSPRLWRLRFEERGNNRQADRDNAGHECDDPECSASLWLRGIDTNL